MKTITITLHDTDNCGSSLQSFALQNFLIKNGIENEIVNYVPSYTKNNGHKFKAFIRNIVFFKDSYVRNKKFNEFVKNNLKLTENKYNTYEDLKKNPPKADYYITGSDQLWNSTYACGRDAAFYLDFVKLGKKISYAVSTGRENIPEDNLKLIKKYAKDFEWISVREKSSVSQINGLFENKNVTHVCDPVLLNDIVTYEGIRGKRMIKEPYILVYVAQLVDTKFIDYMVGEIKKHIDAKVVLIGSYRNRCTCDIHMRDMAPSEFLSLISYAEYIISNSFHATMFSLMYSKQFATLLPPSNGARIKEILDLVDLPHHAINNDSKTLPWINDMDYNDVQIKLDNFRVKSQNSLLKQLRNNNGCEI